MVFLSTRTRIAFRLTLLLSVSLGSATLHAKLNMGMLGDSLTDEYLAAPGAAHTDVAAYSWVQILALARPADVNFGEYRPPDDYWPDRRDAGYEYNWAKVGAAASSDVRLRVAGVFKMRPSNRFMGSTYLADQLEGLLPYVTSGKVDTVFVGAGSNDFFYQSNRFTLGGKAKSLKDQSISAEFIDQVAGALLAVVDRLQAAGDVDILLSLVPMGTASEGGGADIVLAGIAAVNELLRDGAEQRGVATVDLFGFAQDSERSNPDGGINFAGRVIPLDSAADGDDLVAVGSSDAGACNSAGLCAGPEHAQRYRADDGLHPNTIIQGLIANQILEALNIHYDAGIALLSDEEILYLTGPH